MATVDMFVQHKKDVVRRRLRTHEGLLGLVKTDDWHTTATTGQCQDSVAQTVRDSIQHNRKSLMEKATQAWESTVQSEAATMKAICGLSVG
ncbi:hypothetical protein RvY_06125 [Ramazzottius varieornatus]|uniref:Uncharacterized protein n=1 Tax=Ramazzottius varieornatus TaxID=947166 RepID=A0A1D1V6A0_RAMVA|nr:hypothetical protein RvY_06125 [Ramazzottius varieornatus]